MFDIILNKMDFQIQQPYDLLDMALQRFVKGQETNGVSVAMIQLAINNKYPDLKQTAVIIQIIEKLIKDGYVKRNDIPLKESTPKWNANYHMGLYKSTFEGNIFNEIGGYKRQRQIATSTAVTQSLITIVLAVGSVLAAVFAGCMFYFEYLKLKHDIFLHWPPFYQVGFPLTLCSTLLGLATIWLIKYSTNKRQ